MAAHLPDEIERRVNDQIARGRYGSVAEVLTAAMRLLEEHDRLSDADLEWARREVALGLDDIQQGRVKPLDMQRLVAECNAEYDNRTQ